MLVSVIIWTVLLGIEWRSKTKYFFLVGAIVHLCLAYDYARCFTAVSDVEKTLDKIQKTMKIASSKSRVNEYAKVDVNDFRNVTSAHFGMFLMEMALWFREWTKGN